MVTGNCEKIRRRGKRRVANGTKEKGRGEAPGPLSWLTGHKMKKKVVEEKKRVKWREDELALGHLKLNGQY